MSIMISTKYLLLSCMWTFLSTNATKIPLSWTQNLEKERSAVRTPKWIDQIHSPSSNWYNDDILAQSEVIIPEHLKGESGFYLLSPNRQDQLSYSTIINQEASIPVSDQQSLKKTRQNNELKHQRRIDFPKNKYLSKNQGNGDASVSSKYFYKPKPKKYQTLPDEVLKVKPLPAQNFKQIFKAEETPKSIQSVLNRSNKRKPSVYREYALSAIPRPTSNQYEPQNSGYYLTAPESEATELPVSLTTQKEPILYVTQGYRNVLLQGVNKPKKYLGDFQNKQESKKYEIGQVPVKRKLIKRPKVFIENNNQENYEHFNAPSIKQAHVNQHGGSVLNRPSLTENYRDDRLHEPGVDIESERDDDESDKIADDEKNEENVDAKEADDENSDYVSENQGEPEELPDEKTDEENENEPREPDNEHAEPKPVPTKPIYPGQGAWARKNVKHRPHISQHKFINPEANEQRPDGYDIFADLEQFFDSQRNSFERNLGRGNVNAFNIVKSEIKPPKEVTPLVVYDPFQEYGHQNNGPEQPSNRVSIQQAPGQTFFQPYVHHDPHTGNQETLNHGHISQPNNQVEEFVPQRLYTQVRNSENEKHLPYEPARTGTGRLKELIKDSKVHTVYSEEGYEDSAYDHAGHVKKAEQDEGLAKKLKYKSEKSKPKKDKEKPKDNEEGQSKKVLETENVEKQLEDSVPADSAYLPIDNQENTNEDYEPPQSVNTKSNMNKNNNFINTQELKTTHVKDKSNGDVQLEIESEVKVIMQPNNSTKAHKYVKIYPKILKDISRQQNNTANNTSLIGKEIEQKSISSKYNDNTNNTNSGKSKQFIADVDDIHKSSQPAYIPENVEINPLEKKYGEDIFSEDISKLKSIKTKIQRKKRSPEIWFEDVNVDTKFIDKIEHKFEPKKKEKKLDTKKYPYYKRSDVNQDSPLRYAENINNVPVKQDGELSFYKTADRHECPDIPQNIDPVPDHVRNAKEEEEDYDDENEDNGDNETDNEFVTPKGPRITELGDKIDCLKIRYFGTNPLDNPIFKEKNVGPVQSIFEELDKTVKTLKNMPTVPKENFVDKEINNEVDERPSENEPTVSPDTSIEATVEHIKGNSSGISNIQEAASIITNTKVDNPSTSRKNAILPSPFKIHKAATEAVVSLITTPRYTIKLTPNNIYDQIKLLDHLPTEPTTSSTSKKSSDVENSKKKSVRKTTTIAPDGDRSNKNYGTQESLPKNKQIGHETRKGRILQHMEPVTKFERNGAEKVLVLKAEKSLKTKGFSSDNIRRESKSEAKDKENTTPNNQNKRVPKLPQIEPKRAFIVKVIEPEIETNEGHKSQKERPKISNEPDQITDKSSDGSSVINEPQALRYRKRKPMYQIFDINKFLTTTPYPLIDMRPSTVLPKYKVISEVFYKEEIKPNEQLNVFADVLNNIKNSSNFESLPIYAASDFSETDYAPASQNTYKHKHIPIVRVKKYEDETSNYNNKNIEDLDELNRATKFRKVHVNKQHEQQPTKRRKEFNTENNDNSNTIRNIETKPSGIVNSSRRKHKIKRRPSTTTSTTTKSVSTDQQIIPMNHRPYIIDYIEDNEQVIGLVPPENWQYKTIIGGTEDSETETTKKVKIYKEISRKPESNPDPAPVTEIIEEPPISQTVNKYYVIGLKPPLKIKPKPYYQYLDNKKLRRRVSNIAHQRLRNKREAARPTYSELPRNRGRQGVDLETSSEVSESVDDYIPHRPKSYHYDEDTKKIVYHNKPEKEEVEEEIEEIEIPVSPGIYLERAEDATHPTPKKTTTSPLLATATPPADGEGLLDFVLKLKNNPNYKFIPDPTTASPGTLSSAASVSINLQSTTPPAFLNILSKVKSDSRYKYIEDPKEPSAKSKTTTTKPEEEEGEDELEEEEQGKINITDDAEDKLKNIQIFDINQFIPTVQPIVTPTPIDYSKYKTIERPRHNISSRYNADEDRNTEEDESIKRPALLEEQSHSEVSEPSNNSESIIISSTEELSKPTETSVQPKRRRITTARVPESNVQEDRPSSTRTSSRRRARPSSESLDNRPTNSQIIETAKPSEIQISTESVTSDNHGKAKRVYRRRPVRIRSTTEKEVDTDQYSERIVKRSIPEEDDRSRNLENENLEADSSQYILIAKDILQDIIKKNHDKQDKINTAVKALEQDSITSETNYGSESQNNTASKLSVDDASNSTVINDSYTNEDNSPISYNIAQDLIKEVDALAVKRGIIEAAKQSSKYLENTDNNNNTHSKNIEKNDTANQSITKLYQNDNDDKDSIDVGAFNKNYDKDKSKVNEYETDDKFIDTTAKTSENTEQRAVQGESKEISSGGRNYQREEETIIADLLKLIREPFGRIKNSDKRNVEGNKNKTSNDYNLGTKKLLKYTQTLDVPTQYSEENDSDDNNPWVEIINKNYDKSKKHGGNYKPEEIFDEFRNNDDLGKSANIENSKIIEDKIKPDVEIFDQNYNKTAKHGGNYKNDIDNVAESLSQKAVLTEPNSEISRLPKQNEKTEDDKILDVEIINSNYDKTKKHGGNYKEDEDNVTTEDDSLLEKDTSDTNYLIYLMPKPADYNYSLATDYYMPGKKVLKIVKKTKMLERGDQKNKSVVGNSEQKEALVPLENKHSVALDPSFITSETKIGEKRVRKYENSYTPDRAYVDNLNIDKFNSPIDSYQNKIDLKVVPKLTDVVLKPEYFYTDPGLPIQINKLHDHTTKIKLDTEDLERAIAEGDLFKSEDLPIREIVDTRRNDEESNIVITETNKEPIHIERTGKHEIQKKPFFIKDPSKRLYFYATV